MNAGHATGTFVLYLKEEVVDKILKALGLSMRDAEDDELVKNKLGEFCSTLAGNLKKGLSEQGYVELFESAPAKYKNVVPEGAQFDYSLYRKQEITFSFWNQKCIVVEVCMGHVPQKGR